jgi:hypothetical protein
MSRAKADCFGTALEKCPISSVLTALGILAHIAKDGLPYLSEYY